MSGRFTNSSVSGKHWLNTIRPTVVSTSGTRAPLPAASTSTVSGSISGGSALPGSRTLTIVWRLTFL